MRIVLPLLLIGAVANVPDALATPGGDGGILPIVPGVGATNATAGGAAAAAGPSAAASEPKSGGGSGGISSDDVGELLFVLIVFVATVLTWTPAIQASKDEGTKDTLDYLRDKLDSRKF